MASRWACDVKGPKQSLLHLPVRARHRSVAEEFDRWLQCHLPVAPLPPSAQPQDAHRWPCGPPGSRPESSKKPSCTRSAHLNLNLMVGERRRLAEDTVPWVRPRTQQSVFKAERGTVCAPRTQVGGSGLRPGPPPQASGAAVSVCSAQGHRVFSTRSCGQKQVHELPGPTFHALACCAFKSLGMLAAASRWGAAQAWGPPAHPSPFFGVRLEPCSW